MTITGTNLEGAKAVDFGLGAATIKTNSATEVVVLSPPGSGKVQVTVETAGGTSATSPADEYTYEAPPPPPPPAPTVTSIAPSKGPEVGGSEVTITGTNLEGAKAVDFGLGEATIKSNSATEVVVLSPPGSGKVQVTVETAGGTSATSPADEYSYIPASQPSVTRIEPTEGPTAGGTAVTIIGTNLTGVTKVTFAGVSATHDVEEGPSRLIVDSPAGSGMVDVAVTTAEGTSAPTPADRFSYDVQPIVTGLSVSEGPAGGGTEVTITGTGFTKNSTVIFGSTPAEKVTYNSATSLTAIAPPGVGTTDVIVSTPGGSSAPSEAGKYTFDQTAWTAETPPTETLPAPAAVGPTPKSGVLCSIASAVPGTRARCVWQRRAGIRHRAGSPAGHV